MKYTRDLLLRSIEVINPAYASQITEMGLPKAVRECAIDIFVTEAEADTEATPEWIGARHVIRDAMCDLRIRQGYFEFGHVDSW